MVANTAAACNHACDHYCLQVSSLLQILHQKKAASLKYDRCFGFPCWRPRFTVAPQKCTVFFTVCEITSLRCKRIAVSTCCLRLVHFGQLFAADIVISSSSSLLSQRSFTGFLVLVVSVCVLGVLIRSMTWRVSSCHNGLTDDHFVACVRARVFVKTDLRCASFFRVIVHRVKFWSRFLYLCFCSWFNRISITGVFYCKYLVSRSGIKKWIIYFSALHVVDFTEHRNHLRLSAALVYW